MDRSPTLWPLGAVVGWWRVEVVVLEEARIHSTHLWSLKPPIRILPSYFWAPAPSFDVAFEVDAGGLVPLVAAPSLAVQILSS